MLETFTSEYGVATACIAVGGTAAYFGATAAYKSYAATQAAATQAAALETAKVEKSARRVKKKEASALAAESKKAAVKLQPVKYIFNYICVHTGPSCSNCAALDSSAPSIHRRGFDRRLQPTAAHLDYAAI